MADTEKQCDTCTELKRKISENMHKRVKQERGSFRHRNYTRKAGRLSSQLGEHIKHCH